MKKKMLAIAIVLLLSINVLPVYASGNVFNPVLTSEGDVTPASEETVWYTRIYNGMLQKRLWSLTYQKWLTEWEDVAPIV